MLRRRRSADPPAVILAVVVGDGIGRLGRTPGVVGPQVLGKFGDTLGVDALPIRRALFPGRAWC